MKKCAESMNVAFYPENVSLLKRRILPVIKQQLLQQKTVVKQLLWKHKIVKISAH